MKSKKRSEAKMVQKQRKKVKLISTDMSVLMMKRETDCRQSFTE